LQSSFEFNCSLHQTQKGNEWHFGMKAHIGVEKRAEIQAMNQDLTWIIVKRRGILRKMTEELEKELLWAKAYAKVRYRGLSK